MIQRERVTEDIFIFMSDLYAQVTSGIVVTTEGLVVIDSLLYPEETKQVAAFIESRLNLPVRYIINTHHHADHTTGTCFFGEAPVIAHRLCREILNTRGRESLEQAKSQTRDMADVELVLPSMVFDRHMIVKVGNKTLHLEHSPGHSPDSIVVWIEEDNVLFAADTVMPVPFFVDGSYDDFLTSLARLQGRNFENIVQGHGEIILRGEVEQKINDDITYLKKLRIAVDKALQSSNDEEKIEKALAQIRIEACGKSHVLLNGVVEKLHYQNVLALAYQRQQESLVKTN